MSPLVVLPNSVWTLGERHSLHTQQRVGPTTDVLDPARDREQCT
jgi:hypothetical protein